MGRLAKNMPNNTLCVRERLFKGKMMIKVRRLKKDEKCICQDGEKYQACYEVKYSNFKPIKLCYNCERLQSKDILVYTLLQINKIKESSRL